MGLKIVLGLDIFMVWPGETTSLKVKEYVQFYAILGINTGLRQLSIHSKEC